MIYVDEIREYPSGQWAHLWTDGSVDELHIFAQSIGLRREWFQVSRGISGEFPHYDVTPSKRKQALRQGAQYMPLKEWIMRQLAKKGL